MNLLALDTSSTSGSIAIRKNDQVIYAAYFDIKITHSETLMPQIDSALRFCHLQPSDLNGLLIANGPGSFTGLRIGLSTAKGIATALSIPLIPFSTLKMFAANAYKSTLPILIFVDAKMNEVYAALYSPSLEELISPRAIPPKEMLALVKQPVVVIGNGVQSYRQELIDSGITYQELLAHQNLPSATALFSLLDLDCPSLTYDFEAVASIEPMYLRESQAQVKKRERDALLDNK